MESRSVDAATPRKFGIDRPILMLLSGSSVSLLLQLISQPILTRLYSPEAFGIAGYLVAWLSVIGPVASLRYDDAIVLPEADADAARLLRLGLFIGALTATLLLLPSIWGNAVGAWLGVPGAGPWLWLIGIGVLGYRLTRLGETWSLRCRRFGTVTKGQVVNAGAMTAGRLGFATLSPTGGGLAGGFVLAQYASAALYGRGLVEALRSAQQAGAPTVDLARRYRDFTLFSTPATLVNTLVSRLPLLVLPVFFAESAIGQFSLAVNMMSVPLGVLSGAVAQVFYVRAAEAQRSGGLQTLAAQVHDRLVLVGIGLIAVVVAAGPELFAVAFGPEWQEAGHYARLVAPWMLLTSVASPMTRLFDVTENQRTDLYTGLFMLVVIGVAAWLGGATGRPAHAIMLVGVGGLLSRTVQLALALRLAHVPAATIGRTFARALPGSVALGACVYAATLLRTPVLTLLVAGAGFMLYLWLHRRRLLPAADQSPLED